MLEVIVGTAVIVVPIGVKKLVTMYRENAQYREVIKAYRETTTRLNNSLDQYSSTYSFDECDKLMIEAFRTFIKHRFPDGITEEFEKCTTLESKEQLAYDFAQELQQRIGISINENIIFEDSYYGDWGTTKSDGIRSIVYINRGLLLADPEYLVQTICHELRHCVQIQASTNNIWNFPPERVAGWVYSRLHYQKCEGMLPGDYDAYRKQIIETDANNFAEAVLSAMEPTLESYHDKNREL